jgi:hypothetical protein
MWKFGGTCSLSATRLYVQLLCVALMCVRTALGDMLSNRPRPSSLDMSGRIKCGSFVVLCSAVDCSMLRPAEMTWVESTEKEQTGRVTANGSMLRHVLLLSELVSSWLAVELIEARA